MKIINSLCCLLAIISIYLYISISQQNDDLRNRIMILEDRILECEKKNERQDRHIDADFNFLTNEIAGFIDAKN